ncbi:uncharacterized protein LOC111085389 [Limulus polyphemus]|uniref:Uncharacterized protein LOC111085389 n=1 Tax=Limulus polyphemus TaxID=6850 RepID=A0ABM1S708_LIMPO|nr:uncharacterized protein LOC111085389 [Limulus polyphemus]
MISSPTFTYTSPATVLPPPSAPLVSPIEALRTGTLTQVASSVPFSKELQAANDYTPNLITDSGSSSMILTLSSSNARANLRGAVSPFSPSEGGNSDGDTTDEVYQGSTYDDNSQNRRPFTEFSYEAT